MTALVKGVPGAPGTAASDTPQIDASTVWSVGLVFLCILGWIGAFVVMGGMDFGPGTSLHDFPTFLICWVIMLTAMMLPSELLYVKAYSALLESRSSGHPGRATSVAWFIAGYGIAWIVYGVLAYGLDALVRATLEDAISWVRAWPTLVGSTLILAGVYQISPWKHACLKHCRSPISYFARNWRVGSLGSLHMGLKHGLICVGCCWALMAVMFAVGAMSLVWMGLLTLLMFAEKMFPFGRSLTVPIAAVLWAMGIWIAASPDTAPLIKSPWLFDGICLAA